VSLDHQRLEQFTSLEFLARQVVEGFITGLHKSPFHGFSVEFAEHRLYNSGESIRSIDWKLYGRTDRLYVKRYEEETNLRCQIFLDNSSSMYYPVVAKPDLDHPNKITFSVYVAASLVYMLGKQRDAAGLSIFSDTVELHTQTRSNPVHQKYLYTELEKLLVPRPPDKHRSTRVAQAIHELAERIHKRSLVVIFSDMFDHSAEADAIFPALQHLRHNKHEVVLFHVVDKSKEFDFDFDERPYKFVDIESGEQLKLHPAALKQRYIELMNQYKNELKLKCGQYRIDFVEADIHAGFEQVLLPYLLKRNKLF
jgi:uncharacterized protein (DUF58 family)